MVNNRRLALPNPHLTEVSEDFLYHLGLSTHDNLGQMFGDIKVPINVCYIIPGYGIKWLIPRMVEILVYISTVHNCFKF